MDARFELEFECQESWEEMRELQPGERRCERCSETVVDLSRLTKKEALAIVTSDRPPCVNYRLAGDEPIFRRDVRRGSMLAAAAGLLAACSTPPAEPPVPSAECELVPEASAIDSAPQVAPPVAGSSQLARDGASPAAIAAAPPVTRVPMRRGRIARPHVTTAPSVPVRLGSR